MPQEILFARVNVQELSKGGLPPTPRVYQLRWDYNTSPADGRVRVYLENPNSPGTWNEINTGTFIQVDESLYSSYEFCDGTTLNRFRLDSLFPYAEREETLNSSSCTVLNCDLEILLPVAVQEETAIGANDAEIKINASTSNPPVEYSINNVDFQTSNVFTGLSAGLYNVYAKDAGNCTDSVQVAIPEPINYNTKYTGTLQSYYGIEYKVDILQKGYSGSPITINRFTSDAIIHTVNNAGDDKFEPIKTSEISLGLIAETEGQYSEFYTETDELAYQIAIYKDNNLYFKGFVVPAIYEETFDAPPYPIVLKAIDGLAYLKNLDFVNEDGSRITGRISLFDSLITCFDKLQLELGYVEALNIYETRQGQAQVLGTSFSVIGVSSEFNDVVDFLQNPTRLKLPLGLDLTAEYPVGELVKIDGIGVDESAQILDVEYDGTNTIVTVSKDSFYVSSYTGTPELYLAYPEIELTGDVTGNYEVGEVVTLNSANYGEILAEVLNIRLVGGNTRLRLLFNYSASQPLGTTSIEKDGNALGVLEQTICNSEIFEGKNCLEVVTEIMKIFGCRIVQINGEWWVEQINEKTNITTSCKRYDFEGSFVESFDLDPYEALNVATEPSDSRRVLVGSSATMNFLQAVKTGNVRFDVGLRENLLPVGEFEQDDFNALNKVDKISGSALYSKQTGLDDRLAIRLNRTLSDEINFTLIDDNGRSKFTNASGSTFFSDVESGTLCVAIFPDKENDNGVYQINGTSNANEKELVNRSESGFSTLSYDADLATGAIYVPSSKNYISIRTGRELDKVFGGGFELSFKYKVNGRGFIRENEYAYIPILLWSQSNGRPSDVPISEFVRATNFDEWITYSKFFNSTILSEGNETELRIYLPFAVNDIIESVDFCDINLQYSAQSFTPEKTEMFTATNLNNAKINRDAVDVILGDVSGKRAENTLYKGGLKLRNGENTALWSRENITESAPLLDILADNILSNFYAATRVITGSILGNLIFYNTVLVPQITSAYFIVNGWEYDLLKEQITNIELVEIRRDWKDEIIDRVKLLETGGFKLLNNGKLKLLNFA